MLQELSGYFNSIKEDPSSNEVHIKGNKEKSTGNQQWQKKNQDSHQQFGPEEELNIQAEQNEEIRFQKNKERLRNLQDILKRANHWIIGVPEGEEEHQEIEHLFEQIMKENFPNLAKEIDFQEVQEAQSIPKNLDPRR